MAYPPTPTTDAIHETPCDSEYHQHPDSTGSLYLPPLLAR